MIMRSAVALFVLLIGYPVHAQEPAKPVLKQPTVTALMVEVTIARHLGEKRLSSTPYEVSVIPGDRSQLRMGGDVPVPSTTFTPAQKDDGGKPPTPITSFSYRQVGTDIDVTAAQLADGQYRLTITIEETSIYPPELAPPTTKTTGAPAFRRFRSANSVVLRDGQGLEYVMATDRISGEVYRINVKMDVVK
jgi:hypothetical protein